MGIIDTDAVLRAFMVTWMPYGSLQEKYTWASRHTPPDYKPGYGAGVLFYRRGGDEDESGAVLTRSYAFELYGADEEAIRQAEIDLYGLLTTNRSYLVMSASPETPGEILYKGDQPGQAQWPFVIVFFSIMFRNIAVVEPAP